MSAVWRFLTKPRRLWRPLIWLGWGYASLIVIACVAIAVLITADVLFVLGGLSRPWSYVLSLTIGTVVLLPSLRRRLRPPRRVRRLLRRLRHTLQFRDQ